MMDVAPAVPWIAFAISLFTFLGLIKGALSSGEKKLEERMAKAEKTLVDHDRRIQTVEGEIKHLPTREAQHQIEIGLERINGRLETLSESLKPIKANGEMLNELLREQVKSANK